MILLILLIAFGLDCFFAWIAMLLWNYIALAYSLPPVTFWVSFCIVLLLSFIGNLINPNRITNLNDLKF